MVVLHLSRKEWMCVLSVTWFFEAFSVTNSGELSRWGYFVSSIASYRTRNREIYSPNSIIRRPIIFRAQTCNFSRLTLLRFYRRSSIFCRRQRAHA
jgi:hypothetical protein